MRTCSPRLRRPVSGLALLATVACQSIGGSSDDLGATSVLRQPLVPSGFSYETILSGLDQATTLVFLPENRLLIGQKAGLVRVAAMENGEWALRPTPFVDLEDECNAALDRGLLSVAVHPDFPEKPWVYVFYAYEPPGLPPDATLDGSRVGRVVRFTADASKNYEVATADPPLVILGKNSTLANIGDPSEWDSQVFYACQGETNAPFVEDCIPLDSNNHAGGMLAFGKDGSLFVATGDGTPPNGNPRAMRSQYLESLAGKLLRIDPETGLGLDDNPFYDGDAGSNTSRVYSYGLRNPFRIAIHPTSGEVYIGDVGWNSWEELNVGRGLNFGWPCYEGNDAMSLQQPAYAERDECVELYADGVDAVARPLYAYPHDPPDEFGASIILGDFYVGTSYPAAYQGSLFFYDFNDVWMRTAAISGNQAVVSEYGTELGGDNDYENGIVHMVRGPDTNLYTANLSTIRVLRYTEGNTPPIAVAEASPEFGPLPLEVTFDGSGSSDPDGDVLIYEWDFGDGTRAGSATPTHTYTRAGTYEVELTVTDPKGDSSSANVTVYPGNDAPVVTMVEPPEGTTFVIGQNIPFSGTATDTESGDLTDELEWEVLLHHNDHTHFDVFSAQGASGSFVVEDHGELNWYLEICATATDSDGLSAEACRKLPAKTVSYCFDTTPPGLNLDVSGVSRPTPFSIDAIQGSSLLLAAPSPQGGYTFESWSQGGERSQSLAVGTTPAIIHATFEGSGTPPLVEAGAACADTSKAQAEEAGCGCRAGARSSSGAAWLALSALMLLSTRRRRR